MLSEQCACGCGLYCCPCRLLPVLLCCAQALAIATKINKGTIEIVSEVHLIKAGDKVRQLGEV